MNTALLDLNQPIVFVPVHHHSPACARLVRDLALRLRPAAVLIEGPADFNERLHELRLPHKLPIAIYSYVQFADNQRRGAFYPFCEHSPEWQALQVAHDIGAAVRFIDLPWAALADQQSIAHRYADHELRENPYIPTLCHKLGVEDFDALWDRLAEIEPHPDPIQLLERIHQLCYHIRTSSQFIRDEDLRREAFMRQHIRRAQAEFNGQLLVITGGFHSHALLSELPNAASDDALLDSLSSEAQHQGIALTPFSEARLDSLTGYEAGMPSPGFYRHVWRDRQQQHSASYRRLLADAATELRKRGQIASTADLIAVDTSAQALAALRGHAEPWRQDLIDAITSSLIKEAIDPQTRHPFLDALLTVFRGNLRGKLAAGSQIPPLVDDIRAQLHLHQLEPSTVSHTVRLDLSAAAELAGSRTLHQLRLLNLSGFTKRGGTNFATRDDLSTVWEAWEIVWSPDFEAGCIESAIYGSTLAEAASARLAELSAALGHHAAHAARLLLDASLAGVLDQIEPLLERLRDCVRQDSDFLSVAEALGHLLHLYRYDDVLGALGRTMLGTLLLEVFQRALWLLELLTYQPGQERQLLNSLNALQRSFEACEQQLTLDRATFAAVLQRVAAAHAQQPLLRGAATGMLWSLGEATLERVQADLHISAAPEQIGDFLTGLFALARETTQRHPALLATIDQMIQRFDDHGFLLALPAMRLAFTFFTPREKSYIAHTLFGDTQTSLAPLEVDANVAAQALAIEARLFALFQRYGIQGGSQ